MDKFTNKQKEEICDISKIYSNNPIQSIQEINKTKQTIDLSFIKNNAETRDTNTSNSNSVRIPKMISHFNKSEPKEPLKIKCYKCENPINKGEIVYYCKCDKGFIHSNCYLKSINEQNNSICPKCNSNKSIGIYELNRPNNTLNSGLRFKTKNKNGNHGNIMINTSEKKSSVATNERAVSISSNMASTNEGDESDEKNKICMDTNINELEDYDKLCENAVDIPLESMIEILNERENNIAKIDDINNSNKNMALNIRSTLINNKKNKNNNPINIKRTALSPITILNTPYVCNKRKGLSVLKTISNQNINQENNNRTNYINNNINSKINNVQRKLNFLSDYKDEDINIKNLNNNTISSLNNSLLNISNSNYLNNSLRNLDFNDITNEENDEENDDDDKENNPPLLKENSKFVQNEENNNEEINDNNESEYPNNNNCNLEISISGGISHITSDTKKTVDIPITIEINAMNSTNVNYSKETLLIFNTNSLNLEQVLLILKIFSGKMGKDDKIFSNIFKSAQGLGKREIDNILNINNNNYYNVFKETEKINYEKISTLIEKAIDLSMNSLCNIFSILLINDVDEMISENGDYSFEIQKIIKKLETTKVNLLKYFSINTIILDDRGTDLIPKNKNEKNINFISYLYDLTMMCMGFFYSPKNLDELTKSVYLFCCNLEQFTLLNVKLIIKGNQDPSIYIEPLNYPINKINHNNLEIIIGPLLKKEKKIINLVATVILNNPDINITLPLMDVSCEYLSKKKEICKSNDNNLVYSNDVIFKERTDFSRLNIPIIRQKKKLKISYSVMIRNLISKTAQRISRAIYNFKKYNYEKALILIYEAKELYEKFFRNHNEFFKKLKLNLDKNDINNSGYLFNINNVTLSALDNSSFDMNNSNFNLNGNNIIGEKQKDMCKIGNFITAVYNDLCLCVEIIGGRKLSQICKLLSYQQSLSFYRVVVFDDNRFLEDNYLNMNK